MTVPVRAESKSAPRKGFWRLQGGPEGGSGGGGVGGPKRVRKGYGKGVGAGKVKKRGFSGGGSKRAVFGEFPEWGGKKTMGLKPRISALGPLGAKTAKKGGVHSPLGTLEFPLCPRRELGRFGFIFPRFKGATSPRGFFGSFFAFGLFALARQKVTRTGVYIEENGVFGGFRGFPKGFYGVSGGPEGVFGVFGGFGGFGGSGVSGGLRQGVCDAPRLKVTKGGGVLALTRGSTVLLAVQVTCFASPRLLNLSFTHINQ